eukprot:10097662-Karenia_brevis.AAC.1
MPTVDKRNFGLWERQANGLAPNKPTPHHHAADSKFIISMLIWAISEKHRDDADRLHAAVFFLNWVNHVCSGKFDRLTVQVGFQGPNAPCITLKPNPTGSLYLQSIRSTLPINNAALCARVEQALDFWSKVVDHPASVITKPFETCHVVELAVAPLLHRDLTILE